MTKTLQILSIVSALVVVLGYMFVYSPVQQADSAGWLPTRLNYATTTTVGPQKTVTLFEAEASPTCKGRLVTTNYNAINISFDDYDSSTTAQVITFGSTTISTTVGHYQAASTTVMYDSALYGCGLMTARGLTASNTVTISSF